MGDGDPILLYAGYNEIDEARYIVERIKLWSDNGNLYSESAILYRSNAQSRVLEEALLRAQMPYRIYGGQRFFERVEISSSDFLSTPKTVLIYFSRSLELMPLDAKWRYCWAVASNS